MLAIEHSLISTINSLTLPIKLARLSLQPPDTELRMPVFGAKVSNVSDTWKAARDVNRVHEGQDIFAEKGTPVFSATDGYVRRIGTNTLGGNHVFVTGAGGRRYYYAHLDSAAEGLAVGQKVTTDTVLGFVGNTGNAATTPSHLHFGMYEGRVALNPHALIVDR
jgi:murein DD-endopeptidase MepM/ murein hydrolase activator NlpD